MAEEKRQTLVDGLRAIELRYRCIREISSGTTAFYQSQTRLNSPGLGVIMPDSFREIAEITTQCISLFDLEFLQLLETYTLFLNSELNYKWISAYVPAKYLADKKSERNILEYCDRYTVPTNKICFELAPSILTDTEHDISNMIKRLRNRGFHFMISGFGGDTCPLMRLSSFEVDYVMLSAEVMQYVGLNERADNAVKSIIDFVSGLGAEPIADAVANAKQAERLYECECHYCAGSLAGNYVTERYLRRKNDQNDDA